MPRVTRVADDMRAVETASARVRRRDSSELLPLPARLSRGSTLSQENGGSERAMPAETSNGAHTASKVEEKDKAVPSVTKETSAADKPGPSGLNATAASKNGDKMEEMLVCSICCEIIHDCVSLTPCSHKFCAGCYSDWMSRSNECPVCRLKVDTIAKDYQFNAVIETYLQANPDKKRSPEEVKALDAKNKISADTIKQPKQPRRRARVSDNYSDEETEESSSGEESDCYRDRSLTGEEDNDDDEEEYRYYNRATF
uniref:RING-type domain-containing protein n=1 Tax=Plectus sambesii TaxID=2011161 RepID=A0A914V0L3_9BILA